MSTELPAGTYELYYTTDTEYSPLGLDSVDGQPTQLVLLPGGSTPARFTVTKVGTNKFTIQINGSYLAPSGIWVQPGSTSFAWTILKVYTVPSIGGESSYAVWLPDKSKGWNYLVLGGRRGLLSQLPGELQIYLYDDYAFPWWFKKVA